MNSRTDALELEHNGGDREITLGTGALLGIFFGITLVCAVFFGLGYSVGHRGQDPTVASNPAVVVTSPNTASATTALAAAASTPRPLAVDSRPLSTRRTPSLPEHAATPFPAGAETKAAASKGVMTIPPAGSSATRPDASNITVAAHPAASVPTMVQIAAVSQREDADVLVSALKKKGYSAAVRNEPQDTLMHIQLGPFSSRQDADLVRRKLKEQGYNAILK